jgi:hypothetical protein
MAVVSTQTACTMRESGKMMNGMVLGEFLVPSNNTLAAL